MYRSEEAVSVKSVARPIAWRIAPRASTALSPTLTLHLLGNFGGRISEIKHRINRSSVMTQFEMQRGAVVDSRNHLAAFDSIPAL